MADEKKTFVQIGGMIAGPVNDAQLAILQKRAKVAEKWCAEHGKKADELTMQEVMEIRSLPEWKNPT